MIQLRTQKQIPERLSHYTKIRNLKSILSDDTSKGICLWAFSNTCKNDDEEIKMGAYMLKRVLAVLPGNSMIKSFGGYEDSASFSFMEGEVNKHMLKNYGHYRLEFDLRELNIGLLNGGLMDCEYVSYNDLEEFANEYCELITSTYNSIPVLQKRYGKISAPAINNVASFIHMENDLLQKVFCLKEQKWCEEREWRKVFDLKNNDCIHYLNGKPYVEYYLDKSYLTGITVFYTNKLLLNKARKDAEDIQKYISERGYNAKVRIEAFA